METLKLRNGAEEAKVLIATMTMVIRNLFDKEPIMFYELVMKARDHNHIPFGNCGDRLKALGLLETHGGMHDSIRNIVLSSLEGEGLDMRLIPPVTA